VGQLGLMTRLGLSEKSPITSKTPLLPPCLSASVRAPLPVFLPYLHFVSPSGYGLNEEPRLAAIQRIAALTAPV
jgi:hypothetical protein